MTPEPEVRIGVDLGGTATRMVAVRPDGTLAAERVIATAALGADPREGVAALVRAVEKLGTGFSLVGVGIGASGPIDSDGIIRNRDTLPNLSDLSLPDAMESRLEVPVTIDNDSVAFAVGEWRFGAGRGASSIIGVTLGTGIGAAYVDGVGPFRGGDGEHPEGGHISVPTAPGPCYCGLESCWEQAASRRALERLIEREGPWHDVNAAGDAARAGVEAAVALFERYGDAVGGGLVTLCSLFRPRRVVIGGGAAAYADLFLPSTMRAIARPAPYRTTCELRVSELGALAGAIGAACLVSEAVADVETSLEEEWPRSH